MLLSQSVVRKMDLMEARLLGLRAGAQREAAGEEAEEEVTYLYLQAQQLHCS